MGLFVSAKEPLFSFPDKKRQIILIDPLRFIVIIFPDEAALLPVLRDGILSQLFILMYGIKIKEEDPPPDPDNYVPDGIRISPHPVPEDNSENRRHISQPAPYRTVQTRTYPAADRGCQNLPLPFSPGRSAASLLKDPRRSYRIPPGPAAWSYCRCRSPDPVPDRRRSPPFSEGL